MHRTGDLIAVNGNLYIYEGMEVRYHKVCDVEIDEDGNLICPNTTWYLTDSELSNRGIDLTEKQWMGLTKHLLSKEYDLTDEAIQKATEDIVRRCFATTRMPLVEELPNYIAIYMMDQQ